MKLLTFKLKKDLIILIMKIMLICLQASLPSDMVDFIISIIGIEKPKCIDGVCGISKI